MSDQIKQQPYIMPEIVETADGCFLVDKDGKVLERIPDPDECMECGDTGPWVDECTQLCEMCSDWIMGPDDFGDEDEEE
jgi:hypothetical protein